MENKKHVLGRGGCSNVHPIVGQQKQLKQHVQAARRQSIRRRRSLETATGRPQRLVRKEGDREVAARAGEAGLSFQEEELLGSQGTPGRLAVVQAEGEGSNVRFPEDVRSEEGGYALGAVSQALEVGELQKATCFLKTLLWSCGFIKVSDQ